MDAYGQFCSISKALEVVGERWSPLILREMICGSSRFNEIHRGVPRMSPTLLSKRLNKLEKAGVIARDEETGGYVLTSAGWELKPVIESLGVWGQRWVRGQLSKEDLDPDLLMWDMRRRVDFDQFPSKKTCICFEFADVPNDRSRYWLVGSAGSMELCVTDPGFEVDLFVTTDVYTLTLVWNGDLPLANKVEDGSIDLHGSKELRTAFQSWWLLSLFAGVAQAEAS